MMASRRGKRGVEIASRQQWQKATFRATCEQRVWPCELRLDEARGVFQLDGEDFYEVPEESRGDWRKAWHKLYMHLSSNYPIAGQEFFRTKYPRRER